MTTWQSVTLGSHLSVVGLAFLAESEIRDWINYSFPQFVLRPKCAFNLKFCTVPSHQGGCDFHAAFWVFQASQMCPYACFPHVLHMARVLQLETDLKPDITCTVPAGKIQRGQDLPFSLSLERPFILVWIPGSKAQFKHISQFRTNLHMEPQSKVSS